jgi:hypothetical protein
MCAAITSGCADIRTGIYTPHSGAPNYQSWFYQAIINNLKMGTGSVFEKLESFHNLAQLSVHDDFIVL